MTPKLMLLLKLENEIICPCLSQEKMLGLEEGRERELDLVHILWKL